MGRPLYEPPTPMVLTVVQKKRERRRESEAIKERRAIRKPAYVDQRELEQRQKTLSQEWQTVQGPGGTS